MEGGGGRVPGGRTQVPVRGGQVSDGTVCFDLLLGKGGESRKSKVGNENVVCHNLGYGAGNRNIRHEIATL